MYSSKLFAAVMLLAVSAIAQVTEVQNIRSGTSGAPVCSPGTTCPAAAFTSNLLAGDAVGVCAWWSYTSGSGGSLSSISDTQSLSYTVVTATKVTIVGTNYTELGVECGYSTTSASAAADTVTCHLGGSPTYSWCFPIEMKGQWKGTLALGPTSTGSGTSTAPSTGNVTTARGGALGLGVVIADGNQTVTAGSGWTGVWEFNNNPGAWIGLYETQATPGTLTANVTITNSAKWVAAMIVFYPPPHNLTMQGVGE